MKKTIEGTIESINEQLKKLRKTSDVKIGKVESNLKGEIGKKRIIHTVELELVERLKQ